MIRRGPAPDRTEEAWAAEECTKRSGTATHGCGLKGNSRGPAYCGPSSFSCGSCSSGRRDVVCRGDLRLFRFAVPIICALRETRAGFVRPGSSPAAFSFLPPAYPSLGCALRTLSFLGRVLSQESLLL